MFDIIVFFVVVRSETHLNHTEDVYYSMLYTDLVDFPHQCVYM